MRSTLLTLTCIGGLAWSGFVAAGPPQEPESGSSATHGRVGFHTSYARGTELNGSLPIDLATASVRWTHPLRRLGPLGGASSWGVEAAVFAFDDDGLTPGAGVHVVYELRARDAVVGPVLRVGMGVLGTARRVPAGETYHNFSLFAGLGVEVALAGDRWLEAGYRLHHVSNADTGVRNLGINAHSVVLGFSWALGR